MTSPRVTLRIGGRSHVCRAGSDRATVMDPAVACPSCGAKPLVVAGTGRHIAPDDRAYEASAQCLACRAMVGTLRAAVDTIFGIEEDESVLLSGRCRVY